MEVLPIEHSPYAGRAMAGKARIIVPLTAQHWQKWRWVGCRNSGGCATRESDDGERRKVVGLAHFVQHGVQVLQHLFHADGVELARAVETLLNGALEIVPRGLRGECV